MESDQSIHIALLEPFVKSPDNLPKLHNSVEIHKDVNEKSLCSRHNKNKFLLEEVAINLMSRKIVQSSNEKCSMHSIVRNLFSGGE